MEQHGYQRRGHEEGDPFYEAFNLDLANYTLIALIGLAAIVFAWRTSFRLSRHIRHIACLNNDRQLYFTRPSQYLSGLKRHLIDAPLFTRRHHEELRLSRAVNMGTLPSRFQTLLIFLLLGMNVILCVVVIPYGASSTSADSVGDVIRNRFGTMATVNLVPLVLLAGRNNPLISLLQIPFDTFNLLHRWLARIVIFEGLAHAFAWCIPKASEESWGYVGAAFTESSFLRNGLIVVCSFAFLLLHSPSPIRHAFYESFLHLHILVVAVAFVYLWRHLEERPAQHCLLAAIILWALERTIRLLNILYRNWSRSLTTAIIELIPGDAMRVSLSLPHPFTLKPGQHIFLCIPMVGWWTFHPFSICWGDLPDEHDEEQLPKTTKSLSLLIRRRTGFTDTLFQRTKRAMDCQISVPVLVEGPYGGGNANPMGSYGTVLLFAAGIGITHQLLFVRGLVAGYAKGTFAVRRITLLWVVREPDHLDWVQGWLGEILRMEGCGDVLRVRVYVTTPCDVKEIRWLGGDVVDIRPGRPDVDAIIKKEVGAQIGAMGVLVCGTGSMSDDVRAVCRDVQGHSQVDFIEESFTW